MKKIITITLTFLFFTTLLNARISSLEQQYIDLIKKVIEFGKYKDALDLCETVIKYNKESAEGYLWKGVACELLDDTKTAERMYARAKELDPTIKIPDITKYRILDKERKKNNEKIKARYYELFGKKENSELAELPKETGIKEDLTLPKVTSKEKYEEKGEDREYWVRGGKAKMLALGGIEFVYPDATTAMDGFGNKIDAGLLFRKTKHIFNLEPYYSFYTNTVKYATSAEDKFDTMVISVNDSGGEISWANPFFLNRIVPLISNSYKVNSVIPSPGLPDINKNAGTLLGGLFTMGIKPVPVFGITGTFGYKYSPYFEVTESGGVSQNSEVKATEILWGGGTGLMIPYLFTNQDELDFTLDFSSFTQPLDFLDLDNNLWFTLPDSLKYSYNFQRIVKTKGLTLYEGLPSLTNIEDSQIREVTGLNIKGNIHYMFGNGLHEFFIFSEAPFNISYKTQLKHEEKLADLPITLTSTSSEKIEIAKGRFYNLKTGLRNNLYYVTTGVKYEFNYSEMYYDTTLTAKTGKEIEKRHKITGGLNVTPIKQISVPLELSYTLYNLLDNSNNNFSATWNVKGGIEIKPVPVFAIRSGIGYEFTKNTFSNGPSDGTENNPYLNALSYHLGAGFDLPFFELNAGGVYKELYPTPEIPNITTAYNYQMIIYADINIYL
jgi:tetratricopeptide (TPR) repeat protein